MVTAPIVTRADLVRDLKALGVQAGDTLLVHTSMKALGYVVGGAEAVCRALLEAVGQPDLGTVMVPTFTGDCSDPADWRAPPVPPERLDDARAAVLLDCRPDGPTRGVGVVPEAFRHLGGAVRSPHPTGSFTAIGMHADTLCARHPLRDRFGHDSPLGRLAYVGGKVLMLGAPLNTATFLYLAEYDSGTAKRIEKRYPVNGKWVTASDIELSDAWFYEAITRIVARRIASLDPRLNKPGPSWVLFPARAALDAVLEWRKQPETAHAER